MQFPDFGMAPPRVQAARFAYGPHQWSRFIGFSLLVMAITGLGATQTWASAQIASFGRTLHEPRPTPTMAVVAAAARAEPVAAAPAPGVDIDGDGRADFVNPTGRAERTHDTYGSGAFGASRDGGGRVHEGVDYTSRAGQAVAAPMSGYVTRVGYAYPDDSDLRSIEIVNPALHYVARLLYVSPSVRVGQTVALGQIIGRAQSLQERYPMGMTNHVHLQIAREGRAWMNCERLIPNARG